MKLPTSLLICAVGALGLQMWAQTALGASVATGADTTETSVVVSPSGAVRNVAFYYGGDTKLDTASAEEITTLLGHPAIVVSNSKTREAETASAIRSIGAEPYRYVQFYWAPDNVPYEGIDLQAHPEWRFCTGSPPSPALGRVVNGANWYFLDANKVAGRQAIRARLEAIRDAGWSGVMFDRGQAATQYAADINGRPIWHRVSTCPGEVYRAGRTFADAYIDVVGMAHSVGLEVMFNNGISPFAPTVKMRPDPRDRDCRSTTWSACNILGDVWPKVDLVLNEAATRPQDIAWTWTFAGNQRSERDAANGHKTVALITTSALGGADGQTRRNVYYAWARIKLFNMAVAVNTGDGECSVTATTCNHYGTYPELVDTTFGPPLGSRPAATKCSKGSTVHCVWLRRYSRGMNILNVSGAKKIVRRLALGTDTCRYVWDQFARTPLAGNRCVKRVTITMAAWTGHPLKFSRERW